MIIVAATEPDHGPTAEAVKRAFTQVRQALLHKLQANKMSPVTLRQGIHLHAAPSTPGPALYIKADTDPLKAQNSFYNIYVSARDQTLEIVHAPRSRIAVIPLSDLPAHPQALLKHVLDIIADDLREPKKHIPVNAAAEPGRTPPAVGQYTPTSFGKALDKFEDRLHTFHVHIAGYTFKVDDIEDDGTVSFGAYPGTDTADDKLVAYVAYYPGQPSWPRPQIEIRTRDRDVLSMVTGLSLSKLMERIRATDFPGAVAQMLALSVPMFKSAVAEAAAEPPAPAEPNANYTNLLETRIPEIKSVVGDLEVTLCSGIARGRHAWNITVQGPRKSMRMEFQLVLGSTSAGTVYTLQQIRPGFKPMFWHSWPMISADVDTVKKLAVAAAKAAVAEFRALLSRALSNGGHVQAAAEPRVTGSNAWLRVRDAVIAGIRKRGKLEFVVGDTDVVITHAFGKVLSVCVKDAGLADGYTNLLVAHKDESGELTPGLQSQDRYKFYAFPTIPESAAAFIACLRAEIPKIIASEIKRVSSRAQAAAEPGAQVSGKNLVAVTALFNALLPKLKQAQVIRHNGHEFVVRASASTTRPNLKYLLVTVDGNEPVRITVSTRYGVDIRNKRERGLDFEPADVERSRTASELMQRLLDCVIDATAKPATAAAEPPTTPSDEVDVPRLLSKIPAQRIKLPFGLDVTIKQPGVSYNVELHVTQGDDNFVIGLTPHNRYLRIAYDTTTSGSCRFRRQLEVRHGMTPKTLLLAVIQACGLIEASKSVWGPLDTKHVQDFIDGFTVSVLAEADVGHPDYDEDNGQPRLDENYSASDLDSTAQELVRKIARRFVGATRSRVRDYVAEHGSSYLPSFTDLGYFTHQRTIDSGSQNLTDVNIKPADNCDDFVEFLDDAAAAITGHYAIEPVVDRERGTIGFGDAARHVHAATEPGYGAKAELSAEHADALMRTLLDHGVANKHVWSKDKSISLWAPANRGSGMTVITVQQAENGKHVQTLGNLNLHRARGSNKFSVWGHGFGPGKDNISMELAAPADAVPGQFGGGAEKLVQLIADKLAVALTRHKAADNGALEQLQNKSDVDHTLYQTRVGTRVFKFNSNARHKGAQRPYDLSVYVETADISKSYREREVYVRRSGATYLIWVSFSVFSGDNAKIQIDIPVQPETGTELATRLAEAIDSKILPELRSRIEAHSKKQEDADYDD